MHPTTRRLAALLLSGTTLLPFTLYPLPFLLPSALAQATDPRKAEADRLLQQGEQQHQANQLRAAIQSWEQALTLYRQLRDRQSEGACPDKPRYNLPSLRRVPTGDRISLASFGHFQGSEESAGRGDCVGQSGEYL